MRYPRPVHERLMTGMEIDPSGCWLWKGLVDRDGYGVFGLNRRSFRAHRVAYELLVGPIPDGLMIDHLCRVTSCINPDHLEPVTNKENQARGSAVKTPRKSNDERKRAWYTCELCGLDRALASKKEHMSRIHSFIVE